MLQYFLLFLLSTTSVKATTDCPGNYQYERQPPANFTHCNPVKPSLILECSALVPSGSTTVTVDWYWSKNISECGRNITEEQGRFTINNNRASSHLTNVDRITTVLTITSPQTDTGYYWCQVNDPSCNGVFISSNKAPVFDTENMTTCSEVQTTSQSKCAVESTPSLMCIRSTDTTTVTLNTYVETITVSPPSNRVATNILFDITTITSTSYHITSTSVNGIRNTPVPSNQTSSNITTIAVLVVPSISSGVISNTPVPSDRTSNNITTVVVVAVTVLILLATLILGIASVIIIVFIVVKRQPDRRVVLQCQFTNISKHKEDNKYYRLSDIKSNQSYKPSRPLSRPPPYSPKKETEIKDKSITASSAYSSKPQKKEREIKDNKSKQSSKPSQTPSQPSPYSSKPQKKETETKDTAMTSNSVGSSKPQKKETEVKATPITASSVGHSKPQEKETEIKNNKSSQSTKPSQPPSQPPPYSSKPQKKEKEIKDKPVTTNSTGSSEPQEKETEIKDIPVTASSADSSNEVPTYAVLDWENKANPVTKPSPSSDTVLYTTIVKK